MQETKKQPVDVELSQFQDARVRSDILNVPAIIGFPHFLAIVTRAEGINTPTSPLGNKWHNFSTSNT